MKRNELLKLYNEYVDYCKKYRGLNNTKHWKSLEFYLLENYKDIKKATWHDLAGGFTAFIIDNGNTLVIGNDLFDGKNNVIEYNISIETYLNVQDDLALDLVPQVDLRIWGN
tara:strand:+ start:425 stop:760 length:336 start_codon:yes stop_codon:yes gene_type:complete